MVRPFVVIAFALFLPLVSCQPDTPPDPRVEEWRAVLRLKNEAERGDTAARQRHADAVLHFLEKNPDHQRARTVYRDLQLERGRELADVGSYADAAAIFRHLLKNFPGDEETAGELRRVMELRVVTRDELGLVEKGMTMPRVIELLGNPPAGWRREVMHGGRKFESLFYRNADGGVAAVHAEGGRVFAADYESNAAKR